MRGAKTGGAKGFAKGAFKGLRGAIVKPISGGLDFVMKTSEGAHNMVHVGGRSRKAIKPAKDKDKEEDDDESPSNSQIQSDDKSTSQIQVLDEPSKIRHQRPFYGKIQKMKEYHDFQAIVAVRLKTIIGGDYSRDHFLDAVVYDNGQLRLCIILTEERMLIVDALEQTKIRDFRVDQLCTIESRPMPQYDNPLQIGQSGLEGDLQK